MTRVTAPDLELWLCTYLRRALADDGIDAFISNKEPQGIRYPLSRPLVVIRDDSGPRLSHVTFDRSVGVSVLAGTRQNDQPANDLARRVHAILTDDDIAVADKSPIAAVQWDGCTGPYAVADDADTARRYSTVQYTIIGTW